MTLLAKTDAVPVHVPRNTKHLIPVTPDRVRRLREHLIRTIREARVLKQIASPLPTEPKGFAARVARVACSTCRGWCCRKGADDAFLDDQTISRIRCGRPERCAGALLRLYLDLVPALAYEGSCIFHGSKGCVLDRSLRADICNSYFCRGLGAYLTDRQPDAPRIVIAGKGDETRTSAVLAP
jgi:hypothetical protein